MYKIKYYIKYIYYTTNQLHFKAKYVILTTD